MNTYQCPVCGYKGLFRPPYFQRGDFLDASFEVCASCDFEYGVTDYDRGFSHEQYRDRWVANGMKWCYGDPPEGWDAVRQLRSLEDASNEPGTVGRDGS